MAEAEVLARRRAVDIMATRASVRMRTGQRTDPRSEVGGTLAAPAGWINVLSVRSAGTRLMCHSPSRSLLASSTRSIGPTSNAGSSKAANLGRVLLGVPPLAPAGGRSPKSAPGVEGSAICWSVWGSAIGLQVGPGERELARARSGPGRSATE